MKRFLKYGMAHTGLKPGVNEKELLRQSRIKRIGPCVTIRAWPTWNAVLTPPQSDEGSRVFFELKPALAAGNIPLLGCELSLIQCGRKRSCEHSYRI